MRVWCAISAHGYGHLSQVAAVLGALRERVPQLAVHLVAPLPRALAGEMLPQPFEFDGRAVDVGLVQAGPFRVDEAATRVALRALHTDWPGQVEAEAGRIARWRPDLVLADVPYLALAAAAQAGIPGVALASISWEQVLAAYHPAPDPELAAWLGEMRAAYARTTLALLPTPALPGEAFPHRLTIPPLLAPARRDPAALREAFSVRDERPLVMVTMGGLGGRDGLPPFRRERRVVWVLPGQDAPGDNVAFAGSLPGWGFEDVLASVDALVGKPGYSTTVRAAGAGVPFLYVRRGTFPDEAVLCPWLHANGRARALTREAFDAGDWFEALSALWREPAPPPPVCDGASQAADLIVSRFAPPASRSSTAR
jgi:hypothetical protein